MKIENHWIVKSWLDMTVSKREMKGDWWGGGETRGRKRSPFPGDAKTLTNPRSFNESWIPLTRKSIPGIFEKSTLSLSLSLLEYHVNQERERERERISRDNYCPANSSTPFLSAFGNFLSPTIRSVGKVQRIATLKDRIRRRRESW